MQLTRKVSLLILTLKLFTDNMIVKFENITGGDKSRLKQKFIHFNIGH